MRYYEVIFIVQPELGEEAADKVATELGERIESQGGEVVQIEAWGKKRLAYEVQDHRYGTYFIIRFGGTTETTDAVDRFCKFHADVLRSMTVKLAERPEVTERFLRREIEDEPETFGRDRRSRDLPRSPRPSPAPTRPAEPQQAATDGDAS